MKLQLKLKYQKPDNKNALLIHQRTFGDKGRTLMKEEFEFIDKQVREGKVNLKITTYYLSEIKAGLRIEVRRLSTKRKATAEIELVWGDDNIILKKSLKKGILENPKNKEVNAYIDELLEYCNKKGWLKKGDA